jgi:hypothetical protein
MYSLSLQVSSSNRLENTVRIMLEMLILIGQSVALHKLHEAIGVLHELWP